MMKDTKFTPGPWFVIDDHPVRACLHIGSPNDRYRIGDVATVYCAGHNNWDCDAQLIAAAPDLYAALNEVSVYLDERSDADISSPGASFQGNEEMQLLAKIDSILAKARGE